VGVGGAQDGTEDMVRGDGTGIQIAGATRLCPLMRLRVFRTSTTNASFVGSNQSAGGMFCRQ
jgi:hypothetical protein